LRIIAGELKGRKLDMPADKLIRPTSGKVKEALFSMVGPTLNGAVVIDLFSGTGSLGLEAISRGAKKVYFGEMSKAGVRLTSKNISNCKVEDRCVLIQGDWEYVLNQIHEPADLIFIDTPYKAEIIESCLEKIWQRKLLAADGIIAAEHDVRQELPETVGGFSIWKVKKYGDTLITLYSVLPEDTHR
jgi:16S rRNA (guanine966-N2)-methyltransferase